MNVCELSGTGLQVAIPGCCPCPGCVVVERPGSGRLAKHNPCEPLTPCCSQPLPGQWARAHAESWAVASSLPLATCGSSCLAAFPLGNVILQLLQGLLHGEARHRRDS